MLFRSTVAALGVLLAASVAGGIVLAVLGVEAVWNPGLNIVAIILDGTTYWTTNRCTGDDEFDGGLREDAVAGSGGLVPRHRRGAVRAASLASFHRRDVP